MDGDCLDLFRFCRFLRHVGKIMYLLVVGIVLLSWYAVMASQRAAIGRGGIGGVLSLLAVATFNGLVAMLLWSYFATAVTDPGRVPRHWTPFAADPEAGAATEGLELRGLGQSQEGSGQHGLAAGPQPQPQQPAQLQQQAGGAELDGAGGGRGHGKQPRWCKKCRHFKPARSHHCSMQGCCILKMDHYCLWVLNTVGLLNYKAFLLFLVYTMLAAAVAAGLLVRSCIAFFQDSDIEDVTTAIVLFVAFVLDAAFTLSLGGFIAMHGRMVAGNRTTIETFEKADISPWPYDKGLRRNFEQVFGQDWRRRGWLPVHTPRERERLLAETLTTSPEERALQPFGAS